MDDGYQLNEQGLPPVSRALAILAHPDDPEFFAGGTLALLARQGVAVHVLVVTDGSKGSDDRSISNEALVTMRRREQAEATHRLGGAAVHFLDFPDGELRHTHETVRAVVREIRRLQPELVISCDPQRFIYESGFINHTDHRTVGAIVVDAVFPAARNFRYFPELLEEGLEPWYVRELWLAAPLQANHEVSTEAVAEQRLDAILAHKSQFGEGEWILKWFEEQKEKGEPFKETFQRIELGGPPTDEQEEVEEEIMAEGESS